MDLQVPGQRLERAAGAPHPVRVDHRLGWSAACSAKSSRHSVVLVPDGLHQPEAGPHPAGDGVALPLRKGVGQLLRRVPGDADGPVGAGEPGQPGAPRVDVVSGAATVRAADLRAVLYADGRRSGGADRQPGGRVDERVDGGGDDGRRRCTVGTGGRWQAEHERLRPGRVRTGEDGPPDGATARLACIRPAG